MDQTLLNNIILYGGGIWACAVLLMLIGKLYLLYLENKIERLSDAAPSHTIEALQQKHQRVKLIYSRGILIVLGGAFILLFVVIIKAFSDGDDDDDSSAHDSGWLAGFLDTGDDLPSTSYTAKKEKQQKKPR